MVLTLVLPQYYPYILMGLAANFSLSSFMFPLVTLRARLKALTK